MAYGLTPTGSVPRVIKFLLIANIAIFLLDLATHGAYAYRWLALDPERTVHELQLWRLVTYLFVHDTHAYLHILINMLMLWWFGTPLVETMGERKFWWFYISTGVFSGLVSLVFYAVTNNPTVIIGASGALFGLFFAFAKYYPTAQFLMLFLFPVQARYAVLIYGVIELLAIVNMDGIAHITHVGGALFALAYFRFEENGAELLYKWKHRKQSKLQKDVKKSEEELGQVMIDIDPILKKISEHGMNSLTADEKEKLEKASEMKRKQRNKVISLDEFRNRK